MTRISLTVAVCCCLGGGQVRADPPEPPSGACEQAGAAAEQASGLPPGMLLAIGQVESGRRDSIQGRVIPWPWTINAAGKGQWFETKDEAIRAVRAALDAGTRSIDVGCFQISLLHHPLAFPGLEQAFDPAANAAYAARFLTSLFGRTGSWNGAVEAYHSADPVLGFAYRQQVFTAWLSVAPVHLSTAAAIIPKPDAPPMVAMPVVTAGVQVWSPMPAGTAPASIAIPLPEAAYVGPLPVVIPHALMPRR
jgi:hypothetical protein